MFKGGKLTRFGWTVVETTVVFMVALISVVFIEMRMPGRDHTAFYAVIGSTLAIYMRSVHIQRQGERNEDILHGQNQQLAEIKTNVNGQVEAALAAIREDNERAMQFMREHFRVERHDLLGKVNEKDLLIAEYQIKLETKDAQHMNEVNLLNNQVETLTELLKECTKTNGKTKGGQHAHESGEEC